MKLCPSIKEIMQNEIITKLILVIIYRERSIKTIGSMECELLVSIYDHVNYTWQTIRAHAR